MKWPFRGVGKWRILQSKHWGKQEPISVVQVFLGAVTDQEGASQSGRSLHDFIGQL